LRDARRPATGEWITAVAEEQLARTYSLAASEAEHARLIAVAGQTADQVREMCARAGLGAGVRVVDVGCGPVGALLELAEIAGPQGAVVGVDSSLEAVETARAIVSRAGLGHVRVVHGDVNAMEPAAIAGDGALDAAHLRFVLVHQSDPAATLRRVAATLRPGGRVLVSDLVEDARYPRYDPPVPASERAWELLYAAARGRGAAANVARRLPGLCEEAGLRILDARGFFRVMTPAQEFLDPTHAALLSARGSIVGTGLATEADVDAIAEELAAAGGQAFHITQGPLGVQVIAVVP
jgi:ubiquinone/menaquinone biosynthesis C-methylase UbiE